MTVTFNMVKVVMTTKMILILMMKTKMIILMKMTCRQQQHQAGPIHGHTLLFHCIWGGLILLYHVLYIILPRYHPFINGTTVLQPSIDDSKLFEQSNQVGINTGSNKIARIDIFGPDMYAYVESQIISWLVDNKNEIKYGANSLFSPKIKISLCKVPLKVLAATKQSYFLW